MERNVLIPTEGTEGTVSLTACGTATNTWIGDLGGFFADSNGFAIAQHSSDYSLVTTRNPARPSETIVAYADDFFPVWPAPPVGFPTPLNPLFQILPASLIPDVYPASGSYLYLQVYPRTIGAGPLPPPDYASTPAVQTTFQGLAPGMVGVEQINFLVPANQQPGNWALFYNLGSCPNGPGTCTLGVVGLSSPYVLLPVQ